MSRTRSPTELGPRFTTARFETELRQWMKEISAGRLPMVDLSEFVRVDIGALTYLLIFAQAAISGQLAPDLRTTPLPMALPHSPDARTYLFRTHFFSMAAVSEAIIRANEMARIEQQEYPIATQHVNQRSRFPSLPFRRVVKQSSEYGISDFFESDCRVFLEGLHKAFHEALIDHLGFPREMADNFLQPNKELVENIYRHSGSWGLGAIQCYHDGMHICYADLGKGVRESLGRIGETIALKEGMRWNDATAIHLAFRDGVTGLPGESPGWGLHLVRSYVENWNGTMEFRSGRAKCVMGARSRPDTIGVAFLPGVQVVIFLPRPRQDSP